VEWGEIGGMPGRQVNARGCMSGGARGAARMRWCWREVAKRRRQAASAGAPLMVTPSLVTRARVNLLMLFLSR
jgi:hypothetical protein